MSEVVGVERLIRESTPFLQWITDWAAGLPAMSLEAEMRERNRRPDQVAIISVDMIMAFCYEGRLASERVRSLIPAIVSLFTGAYELGIRHFVLVQDAHRPEAREFTAYGRHAVAGTHEAETVPELSTLPFTDLFTIIQKNSLSPAIGTDFDRWLEGQRQLKDLIVVGNCTDLCVYQTAMHLALRANAFGLDYRVIVPADCVQTYDLPVRLAASVGAFPHNGDLLHLLFLYHMALNGITVVRHLGR